MGDDLRPGGIIWTGDKPIFYPPRDNYRDIADSLRRIEQHLRDIQNALERLAQP